MITTSKSKLYTGTIIRNEECAENTFLLEFSSSEPFYSQAGQFISIYCNRTLRRPFSIFNVNQNIISILFRRKGDGTSFLSSLKENDKIDFSGPFGNCFETFNKKSILIGAGLGIAPISYLKRELNKQNIPNILISGFPSKNNIPNVVDNIDIITTDDGTKGNKGNVIQALTDVVDTFKPQVIYACGPRIVLQKISEFAQGHFLECFVSMENMMACSIGVCRGCVIDIKKGNEVIKQAVCKDGPIFKGSEVVW